MLKRYVPIALMGIVIAGATACKKSGGFKTTKDGLEYNIVKDEPGNQNPKIGDIIEIHLYTRLGDSTVVNSRVMNNGQPLQLPLTPTNRKGDVVDGIQLMTPGDSAIFRVAVDSMVRSQLPPFAKNIDKIQYTIVLVSVKSKEQMDKEASEKSAVQKQEDEKILADFLAKNNINAQKTASGLCYTVSAPGSGENPQPGQTVTVNYTGKTLDGKVFDSNIDPQFQHVEPLPVTLGQGQVIQGWEEGLSLLKKGSKATLYIPSTLAYGERSPNPNIPPNAILVFDVEIKDIK